MARSSSRQQPKATTVDWRDYWQHRDAWTVREFALLCYDVNPNGVDNFPDRITQKQYNEASDSINRVVRVKVLPTIDELAWPATGAEVMYEMVPAFKPGDVAAWAVKHYPAFPYRNDPWLTETIGRNLNTLRLECVWTVEHLTEQLNTWRESEKSIDRSNVQDHLNGHVRPNPLMVTAYAAVFTQVLKRPIDLAGLMKDWPNQVCPRTRNPINTP